MKVHGRGGEVKVGRVDSETTWQTFTETSPQGTAFSDWSFLQAQGVPFAVYWAMVGGSPQVAVVVMEQSPDAFPFRQYQGLLLGNNFQTERSAIVMSALLDAVVAERGAPLCLSLHPNLLDLRAMRWWAAAAVPSKTIGVEIKYSAVIRTDADSRGGFRAMNRRRDHARAIGAGLRVVDRPDVDLLCRLHVATLARHGTEPTNADRVIVRGLTTQVLARGLGKVVVVEDQEGVAVSAALCLFDRRSGYVLFWGNDPKRLSLGGSTLLVEVLLQRCRAQNLDFLDLGGANSRGRAEFKASVGAVATPFLEVEIT